MIRDAFLLADIFKSGTVVVFFIHMLCPHGCGSDPQTLLAIERSIDHHGFHGFGVIGNADQLVFIALKVAVSAGFQFFHVCHQVGTVPRELSSTELASNMPENQLP